MPYKPEKVLQKKTKKVVFFFNLLSFKRDEKFRKSFLANKEASNCRLCKHETIKSHDTGKAITCDQKLLNENIS